MEHPMNDPAAARPAAWLCRRCGKPVTMAGGRVPPVLQMGVHAATGEERGEPDEHLVAPIDFEPIDLTVMTPAR